MVKKLVRVLPYLLMALAITIVTSVLDGYVTRRMMLTLDYALKGEVETIKQLAPSLMIMASALIPLGILTALTGNLFKNRANIQLKKNYISRVFHKNIAEFQKENNAKYLSSMTNDFDTLETNLIGGIYTVGSGIVNFMVGIWLLSTVNNMMILLAFAVIGINLLISLLTAKPINQSYKERSDMFDGYTAYIKEVLSAFHIVKNYNLQDKVTKDYYKKSDEIQHKGFLIERMVTFINSTEFFFMNGSIYGIICVIGYFAVQGRITPGGVLLVVEGIQRMTWPLFEISECLPKLFTSRSLIKKMEDTLKNSDTYVETVELKEFKDSIQFNEVDFHYDDDERMILSDINLDFKKNGKYLIVGPSGGGKSTLLKLFRKYFSPVNGYITIDGHNIRDVKREAYFSLVANIEQQVFLFEDSIKNNITLYQEYSPEEINAAVEAAGLMDFINNQSAGLDSIIYDNGRNISGGERSRIVIARALLHKASILFMDEAFASLDMERAREIEKTILNLKNITVINVSHVIFKDTKPLYDRIITVKKTAY